MEQFCGKTYCADFPKDFGVGREGAMKTLYNTNDGIMRLRGTWQSYTSPYLKNPIKAITTYHPSFLLHSPGQKAQSWQDMLMIKKALSTVA
ncbi:hypothetical protein Cva_01093 [Caedimonas varicaedens]|uniref:Uracil DNA glycosylase superfamily protein n=1 Tax=Caedimonas varicaedens TaxID=1629334 RepID=A0A0K8MDZ5_9PROT|nr:hypothetical protein Cva_01093 [Caedimonas varicaedens]